MKGVVKVDEGPSLWDRKKLNNISDLHFHISVKGDSDIY